MWIKKIISDRTENTVEKQENAGYLRFLLVPQYFNSLLCNDPKEEGLGKHGEKETRGPSWPCIAPLADNEFLHTKHYNTWELV